jgi:hypothetical protein
MVTSTYSSTGGRKSRRQRNRRRRWPLWAVLVIALGSALVLFAAVASAAIILHGRGVLEAPASTEQNLRVSDVRLSAPLRPGGTVDLLLSVRNPNAFGTRVDRITLVGALRKAKPAGCTSKVSGPVTKPAGYRLPAADQVLVGAGVKKDVVVHAAFTLAGSAKTGCGFTAEVDVSATQLTPTASPTTANPTPASTSTTSPAAPVTTPPTTVPVTVPTTLIPPGVPPSIDTDCDLVCYLPGVSG